MAGNAEGRKNKRHTLFNGIACDTRRWSEPGPLAEPRPSGSVLSAPLHPRVSHPVPSGPPGGSANFCLRPSAATGYWPPDGAYLST